MPFAKAPYPPLTRSPFPNGEGCDTRIQLLDTTPSPIGKAKRRRLRRKKGSQPRLAALGSPFQGKGLAWSFPPSYGRRCPEGAEVGWGKRYPRHKAFPAWGRLRYENAVFPILSFRAKARNLFRLRSGKGCEDSGEREAPCFQRIGRTVFHADSITKENGNGKRKRSLGCARDDETRMPLFSTQRFPRWGRQRGGGFAAEKGSQPRLAALGSPFQGKGLAWTLPPSYGRRCPEGAEVGWGKRYPRHKAFPAWGRWQAERAG